MIEHVLAHNEQESHSGFLGKLQAVFDRREEATKEHLIKDAFVNAFDDMVQNMEPENQDRIMVKIQRGLVTIGGYMHEYGARLGDFVRNAVNAPMILGDENASFPRNKVYAEVLSVAQSWGVHAKNTQKIATDTRNSYRDHFLPTAATGALQGALALGTISAIEGSKYGFVAAGFQGALIGAGAGGVIGAATPWIMRIKDKLMGPPVLYYSLYNFFGRINISVKNSGFSYA